jgi:soluble lytic murein transglycosylase-like protein
MPSRCGARGYMQVMPFWTNVIGDRNRRALFDMQTNLRYGCAILRMYSTWKRATCSWRWAATTAAAASPNIPTPCWPPALEVSVGA